MKARAVTLAALVAVVLLLPCEPPS